MYRLPGERIRLDLDGPSVEVEPIRSWMLKFEYVTLAGRVKAAAEGGPTYLALNSLFEFFIREAAPQWDIVDHLGPVPNTARGMARLPLELALEISDQWLTTLTEAEEQPEIPGLRVVESSAVDAVIPPGPVNRQIKRRLRAAKAA